MCCRHVCKFERLLRSYSSSDEDFAFVVYSLYIVDFSIKSSISYLNKKTSSIKYHFLAIYFYFISIKSPPSNINLVFVSYHDEFGKIMVSHIDLVQLTLIPNMLLGAVCFIYGYKNDFQEYGDYKMGSHDCFKVRKLFVRYKTFHGIK